MILPLYKETTICFIWDYTACSNVACTWGKSSHLLRQVLCIIIIIAGCYIILQNLKKSHQQIQEKHHKVNNFLITQTHMTHPVQ